MSIEVKWNPMLDSIVVSKFYSIISLKKLKYKNELKKQRKRCWLKYLSRTARCRV